MKWCLTVALIMIIVYPYYGCIGFGYAELNDPMPVGNKNIRVFSGIEKSTEIGHESFSSEFVPDTIGYPPTIVYNQSRRSSFILHGGTSIGITSSDELVFQGQLGIFSGMLNGGIGYRRVFLNTDLHHIIFSISYAYSNLWDGVEYDASRSNDEDVSFIRVATDAAHYRCGIGYAFGSSDTMYSFAYYYCGFSVELNQARSRYHGTLEQWNGFTSPRIPHDIEGTQYRQWITSIPYIGFVMGQKNKLIVGISFPIWYDKIESNYVYDASISLGYSTILKFLQ